MESLDKRKNKMAILKERRNKQEQKERKEKKMGSGRAVEVKRKGMGKDTEHLMRKAKAQGIESSDEGKKKARGQEEKKVKEKLDGRS